MIIGGDWKQLCPVVGHGNLKDQTDASVKNHPIFALFTELTLVENVRVRSDQLEFLELLDRVGTDAARNNLFRIPADMLVMTEEALIDFVYDNCSDFTDPGTLPNRLILCPFRAEVADFNSKILSKFPGGNEFITQPTGRSKKTTFDIYL